MPVKGKHRRPKAAQRLSRSLVVAGTGSAALALPLLGAAVAVAAPGQAAPQSAVQSVTTQTKAAQKPAAAQKATHLYTVKSGDCLSKIADEHHVRGGWHKLYQDNREAVGADPSLIHPGLKLTLGKKAAAAHTPATARAPKPATSSGSSKSSGSTASSGAAKPSTASKSSAAAPKPAAAPAQESSAQQSSTDAVQTATTAASGYAAPVAGAGVGTAYHVAGSMWSSGYHTGVDLVVPTGTPLKAVGTGTVVSAGWGGAYGNQVVIRLADGYYAQYAHLSSLSVSAGQSVAAGQQVGLSGATGNVTGPHLHFEIRTTPDYGSDVDPVAYLRSHGVSLG